MSARDTQSMTDSISPEPARQRKNYPLWNADLIPNFAETTRHPERYIGGHHRRLDPHSE